MSNNRCTVYTRAYTCVRVHRSRYKCHNRALCNSVDVLTTRVEFPSLPLRLSPPLPFYGRFISPSILRTMQRFAQQYTIRGFNPLRTRDSYQGSLRDDSLETVSFYLNTPVLIAPSCCFEFTHVSKFFFFFFCENLSSSNFQCYRFDVELEIQFLSVFTISKCSRIEISNFSDFFSVEIRIFRKSFDLHVLLLIFSSFNINLRTNLSQIFQSSNF